MAAMKRKPIEDDDEQEARGGAKKKRVAGVEKATPSTPMELLAGLLVEIENVYKDCEGGLNCDGEHFEAEGPESGQKAVGQTNALDREALLLGLLTELENVFAEEEVGSMLNSDKGKAPQLTAPLDSDDGDPQEPLA